jgi:hypothetical protein
LLARLNVARVILLYRDVASLPIKYRIVVQKFGSRRPSTLAALLGADMLP